MKSIITTLIDNTKDVLNDEYPLYILYIYCIKISLSIYLQRLHEHSMLGEQHVLPPDRGDDSSTRSGEP